MRLKISHKTEYVYSVPVQYALQRLRLTPRSNPSQKVINWKVDVEGADVQVRFEDQFQNIIELVASTGEPHTITVVATGEVETEDKAGVIGPDTGCAPLWLFNRETALTKPGKLVREISKSASGEDRLTQLHALRELIHQRLEFAPGTTHSQTSAEEALELGSGVCQDHAHVFVSAARHLGIPARYVSGYLMMENTKHQAASHAWAEAYVEGLGWVGFDAANNICPNELYVRIACGLDYKDAAPISGMVSGTGHEEMSVAITVENQGQSQSQSQS